MGYCDTASMLLNIKVTHDDDHASAFPIISTVLRRSAKAIKGKPKQVTGRYVSNTVNHKRPSNDKKANLKVIALNRATNNKVIKIIPKLTSAWLTEKLRG